MIIDISEYEFTRVSCSEGNQWMHDNIGILIRDDVDQSFGEGWRIYYDETSDRWTVEIEDETKASFFMLRWS